MSRENGRALFHDTLTSRFLALVIGVPTTNKLLRKVEEVRLALWLEEEMSRRFGSRAQAKREIFARAASFNYLGNGRYGFAAGSEYYFGKPLSSYTPEDAGRAALLAGITKAPRDYVPVPGDPRPLRRRNEILAPDGPQRVYRRRSREALPGRAGRRDAAAERPARRQPRPRSTPSSRS